MIKIIKKIFILVLAFLAMILVFYKSFWYLKLRDIPQNVKLPLKHVIEAYYLSKITGEYWENQFEAQAEMIAELPQNERVIFFRGVMLFTCDLDTSRSTTFIYKLGKDAEALRENLINLRETKSFQDLSKKQQKETVDWIDELNIIVKQQKVNPISN